jgi:hypothetical protein
VKIRLVGVKLFQADEQTDMTNLTVAFRNFANAPIKELLIMKIIYLRMLRLFEKGNYEQNASILLNRPQLDILRTI